MVRRILTRLSHFLIAVSLAACCLGAKPAVEVQTIQPTWDIPVWIDSAFPPKAKDDIKLAMSEWNAAGGGYLHFYAASTQMFHPIDQGVSFTTLKPFSGVGITVNLETEANPTAQWHTQMLAWVDRVGDADIHVVLSRVVPHYNLRGVVEHEIGHAIGLTHSDHAGNLMSYTIEDQCMCIDDETIKRVFLLHHWVLDYMNPQC